MKGIRIVGLAVIASMAALALPGSASATGGLEADSYPVVLKGTPAVGETMRFGITGIEKYSDCEAGALEGGLSGPSSTAGTAVWLKCNGNVLDMNECEFELHAGTESSMDIGPPSCGPITGVQISTCYPSIIAQTDIPVTVTNTTVEGEDAIELEIDAELENTMAGCAGSKPPVGYSGTWILRGFSEDQEPVGIRATDSFGTGFFISGEESEEEAQQPRFEAEEYPAAIAGEGDPQADFEFTVSGLENAVVCSSGVFDGEISGSVTSLDVGAEYDGCLWGEKEATVAMNSCYYDFGVANSGPPYTGGADLACAEEGDAVTITLPPCTIHIPPQDLGAALEYENQGAGAGRTVDVALEAEGVESLFVGGICQLLGKKHTGTLSDGLELQALE